MATQGGGKKFPTKARVSDSDFYIPPLPVAVVSVRKSVGEEIVGWIFCCILIAFLLPMGALLYLDILEAKHEVKEQTEKIEKLRRQVEKDKRSNENGKT